MADIELIVKIPEEYYETLRKTDMIFSGQRSGKTFVSVIFEAIANGTPLPKGHGRLIDADAVDTRYSDPEVVETLDEAPTIIEADKEREI